MTIVWRPPTLYTDVDVNFECTITILPENTLLNIGLLMFKRRPTDDDADAALSKRITTAFVQGTGQITADGSVMPGVATFQINPADFDAINTHVRYWGEIKFITDTGENLLFARTAGPTIKIEPSVVHAVV
jgi:hypothetical protein